MRHAPDKRWWRFRQAVKLAEKAKALLEARGIDPHTVPATVYVPLLEAGSLVDDESLQDRWAALLANAAAAPDGVPPAYPEILRQLSPRDAKLLDALYEASYVDGTPNWREQQLDGSMVSSTAGIKGLQFELAMDNLMRLRLCGSVSGQVGGSQVDNKGAVRLTALGHEFVRACRPPAQRAA